MMENDLKKKIVKALNICLSEDCEDCEDCPYISYALTGKNYKGTNCDTEMMKDILCYFDGTNITEKGGVKTMKKNQEGYGDLFIYVPKFKQIIRIAEGTGDNLSPEDEENGYMDYIYYEQHEISTDMPVVDGGQILLKEMLRDKYGCLADCIQSVLERIYSNGSLEHIVLK